MSLKRNEFLDADESDEDIGQQSDPEEDTRLRILPSKRRKLNTATEDPLSDSSQSDHVASDDEVSIAKISDSVSGSAMHDQSAAQKLTTKTILKPLTPAQLAASQAKARKTGVIYISRVPPFMKPSAIRNLLSPYGTILRIFLTPEPTPAYQKRIKAGGNKKRSFVDGWVEFASKKKAKIVAESLNGNIIGGKKGSWYHDDIWNIKYLRGFKWADLMEQVQNEEREREGRMRAEVGREAKERKAFLGNLEQQKTERGMEEKRKKKRERAGAIEETLDATPVIERGASIRRPKGEMRFRQHQVKDKSKEKAGSIIGEDHSMSSKIFG